MDTYLPTRLDEVVQYSGFRFDCPRCDGERFLTPDGLPIEDADWPTPDMRLCAGCRGLAKVDFAVWVRFKASDDYAVRLLRRVLRGLSQSEYKSITLAIDCVEILHSIRTASESNRRKFRTFLGMRKEWDSLDKKVVQAKKRLDAAVKEYLDTISSRRLELAALKRELQNEVANRSREAAAAKEEIEAKYANA